jgi:hypothetical protein
MQPMPSSTSIDDLGQELTHHGMQAEKCNHFLTALRTAAPSTVTFTVAQLLEMKEDKVKNLEEASRFTAHESLLLRILLGSSTNPFKFAIEVQQVQPPAAAGDENKTPENKNSLFNEPKPKGGAKKAVSGELKIKREDIKEYYPPPEFDKHMRGSGTRNFPELRRMIIKEMEDFCGHLYPTKEEKDIVLAAIQSLCGPPDNGPHWNFWTSTENGRVMKHKGMAISDLEKARRDPGAYACNGIALEGQMRPSRPVRPVPVLPGYMLMTPAAGSNPTSAQPAPQGSSPVSNKAMNPDVDEEMSEDDILRDAKKRQLEVDEIRKAKEDEKKAKKVSAAAATAAKNAAKKAKKNAENDAKKAAKKAETDATKTSAKRQRTAGPQKDGPVALSNYEQSIQANIQVNNEYLEFLDKVLEKGCQILDKGGDTISNLTIGGFTPDM